jgi:PAS domain S-box-containing protein
MESMAMRGLLRGLSGKETAGGNAVRPIAMADDASRLQLLDEFEAAGIGWLWATDEQNRLTYLSPSAAASFGVAHEDLIGRPLASLFTLEDETGEEATERPLPFLLSARNKFANMTVRRKHAGGRSAAVHARGRMGTISDIGVGLATSPRIMSDSGTIRARHSTIP